MLPKRNGIITYPTTVKTINNVEIFLVSLRGYSITPMQKIKGANK